MKKRRMHSYTEYFDSKEKAVKTFLHYSLIHKSAAESLSQYMFYMFSAGYLYHLAFELLVKAMEIFHSEQFSEGHEIVRLIECIQDKDLFDSQKDILLKIDRMFF